MLCNLRPMKILLDNTLISEQLYPFAQLGDVSDIRIGILTIKEKWEKMLGYPVFTQTNSILDTATAGDVIIKGNIIPSKKWIETFVKFNGDYTLIKEEIKVINDPIQIFQYNDWALREDFELITSKSRSQPISSTNKTINAGDIFLEEGVKMEHCILNASAGPIYIGKNTEIMEGSMIRGPFALCEGAVVKMGAKIYGATTVGPYCVVAGEIKNTVFFGYSNKAHDGYIGDSVIGEWCNLGAGTTNSNVKNTAGLVKLWNNSEKQFLHAGTKCGLLMGDYSRSAINTAFNTGTVVGICCNIFGESFPPKYIPDFSWGNERYHLEKVFADIDNWKKMKGKKLEENEKLQLTQLFYKKQLNY